MVGAPFWRDHFGGLSKESGAVELCIRRRMSLAETVGAGFVDWVETLPDGRATRVQILCDSDADGLPAGALLVRTFRAAGFGEVSAEARRKGESAWGAEVLERLRGYAPGALVVADLGSRDGDLLPGVPTLLLDHHCPIGKPDGALLLTGYGTGAEGGDGKDVADDRPDGVLVCARAAGRGDRRAVAVAGRDLTSERSGRQGSLP